MNVAIDRKLNLLKRNNREYAFYNLLSIFVLSYISPIKYFKFLFPLASSYYLVLKRINIDKLVRTIKIINKTKIVSRTPNFSPL